MKPSEQERFDALYEQHLRGLKLHGYSASTIDVYARAVRRMAAYFIETCSECGGTFKVVACIEDPEVIATFGANCTQLSRSSC